MRKKLFVFVISLLSLFSVFIISASAEDDATYLSNYKKVIYNSNTVESINNEFLRNGYAAKTKYEAQGEIAVFGEVDSISTNGKELNLSSKTKLKFVCTANTTDAKATLAELSAGDSILVIGKIKSISDTQFKLDIEGIYQLSGSVSGKVMESGIYFPEESIKGYSLFGCNFETAFNSDVTPEKVTVFSENDGVKFQIADNESVSVYCLDYQKVYKDSGYSKILGRVPLYEKRTIEDYANGKIIQKHMIVSSSTKKVNDVEYDYYTETRASNSNEHAEVYYKVVDSENIYVVAYEYEGVPQYVQFAAFVLSTFSIS